MTMNGLGMFDLFSFGIIALAAVWIPLSAIEDFLTRRKIDRLKDVTLKDVPEKDRYFWHKHVDRNPYFS